MAAEIFRPPRQNFAALDGIRAIAVLLILCFHAALYAGLFGRPLREDSPLRILQWFTLRCWIGIDVFFVLSGFLIGRILLAELSRGTISFKAFYVRRTLRIFPAYYLALTASVLVFTHVDAFKAMYLNLPSAVIIRGSWANYLYVSNYVFGRQPNAFPWGWSLCVEEHFYLFLPLTLALLFSLIDTRRVGMMLGLLIAAPVLARTVTFARHPELTVLDGVYYYSHTHCDGLFVGVAIAYLHVHYRSRLSQIVWALRRSFAPLVVACLLSVFLWGGLERTGLFPMVLQFLVLAVATGLLVVNGLLLDNRLSRTLAGRLWYPVARTSYGIYLVHPFAFAGLASVWPGGQDALQSSVAAFTAFTLLGGLIAVATAIVLFLVVEHPLLRLGTELSRRYGATVGDSPRLQIERSTKR